MKQVCLLCERTSPGGNLFCQETYCPAEMSPTVLDRGDWFGDIEIVKPLVVLRSAVLYEAMHGRKKVFLKVAHPGAENKERLKREAEFLRTIRGNRQFASALPVLLPPYANTTINIDAYGKSMLRGHLLYFFVFEHNQAEPLRAVLLKNPQLWINHIGWLMLSLATTVSLLQHRGLCHLGLQPDCVLLRMDDQNLPRILLFDLGIASTEREVAHTWYSSFVPPAYTAPELVADGPSLPTYRTDVYGLGLILYELLVGEPTFPYKLRSDADVYRAVQRNQRIRMNRVEDVEAVANIALQAVSQQAAARQANAREVGEQLLAHFGKVPEETRSRVPSAQTLFFLVGAALTLAFIILLVGWPLG